MIENNHNKPLEIKNKRLCDPKIISLPKSHGIMCVKTLASLSFVFICFLIDGGISDEIISQDVYYHYHLYNKYTFGEKLHIIFFRLLPKYDPTFQCFVA